MIGTRRTYTVTAGVDFTLGVSARRVKHISGPDIYIGLGEPDIFLSPALEWERVEEGEAGRQDDGKPLQLTVRPVTSGNLTLEICDGCRIKDHSTTITNTIDVSTAAGISTAADVAVSAAATVQIVAANSARRAVILSVISGSAGAARVGDSNTGSARGVEVPVGGSVTLETQAAVYAYSAAGCTVGICEVYDV